MGLGVMSSVSDPLLYSTLSYLLVLYNVAHSFIVPLFAFLYLYVALNVHLYFFLL